MVEHLFFILFIYLFIFSFSLSFRFPLLADRWSYDFFILMEPRRDAGFDWWQKNP